MGLGLALGLRHSNQTAGAVLLVGLGSYVLAPPVIHVAHERWGIATASLSLRVLAPFVGAVLGGAVNPEPCPNDNEFGTCGSEAAVGALSGMVLASVVDAGLFSYENRKPETATGSTFGLAPAPSADGKRAELRAFGTF